MDVAEAIRYVGRHAYPNDKMFQHSHRVRSRVAWAGEEVQLVAMLHDVLEDTKLTAQDLLDAGFSDEVVDAVVWLTRTPPFRGYMSYVKAIKRHGGWMAVLVKLADLEDHIRQGGLKPSHEKRYWKAIRLLLEG